MSPGPQPPQKHGEGETNTRGGEEEKPMGAQYISSTTKEISYLEIFKIEINLTLLLPGFSTNHYSWGRDTLKEPLLTNL